MLVQQIAGGTVQWGQLPIYLLAEFAGGVAAAFVYGFLVTARSTARTASVPASRQARDTAKR
jgi:glycerol uptake facilitator protein